MDVLEPVDRATLVQRLREATVLDVRPPEEYRAGHIRSAVNVPLAELAKAVRIAIERIAVQHPRLGEHLAATIHTGAFCRYQPREPAGWDIAGRGAS